MSRPYDQTLSSCGRPTMAQALVKHIARLRWKDADGEEHSERHVAWDARKATTQAYRRAKSMMTAGQAQSYRIEHSQIGTVA